MSAFTSATQGSPPQPQSSPGPLTHSEARFGVLIAGHVLGHIPDTVRKMDTVDLRFVEWAIGIDTTIGIPSLNRQWGNPEPETPSFWVSEVVPAIRAELKRRFQPKRTWPGESPIAKIKRENRVEDVAGRFTQLVRSGANYTAKCPLHAEQRGRSFHIWTDSQRWKCFGRCGIGGDAVDLIKALDRQGLLT